jgi:hypothetical protein
MNRLCQFICLAVVLFMTSCKKNSQDIQPGIDMSSITYEIQTSITGFDVVRYVIDDGSEWGIYENWTISEPGTFNKTVKLKKGMLAELLLNIPHRLIGR